MGVFAAVAAGSLCAMGRTFIIVPSLSSSLIIIACHHHCNNFCNNVQISICSSNLDSLGSCADSFVYHNPCLGFCGILCWLCAPIPLCMDSLRVKSLLCHALTMLRQIRLNPILDQILYFSRMSPIAVQTAMLLWENIGLRSTKHSISSVSLS